MEENTGTLRPRTAGRWEGEREPTGAYRVYVLALLSTTYLLNQLDRFMLSVVTRPMAQDIHYGDLGCVANNSRQKMHHTACNATDKLACSAITDARGSHLCAWNYTGQGMEYQLLIGPIFIVVYTLSGILVSFAADQYSRKGFLVVSLMFWSLMTVLTAEVKTYWQLVLVRLGLGIGEAGCTPFATSLLADYFDEGYRASALGVYNWGIYVGFSLTYAIGNFVTDANLFGQGWRWAFYISGWPGIFLAALIMYSLREPRRRTARQDGDVTYRKSVYSRGERLGWCERLGDILQPFTQPSVLLLCLAGSVRNAAGYVWAYNTQLYYQSVGETTATIGSYMSWIPLLGGSIGVILGGFISDRIVRRIGPRGRLIVLTISQVSAVPFVAGALYLDPPYAYLSLLPGYIIVLMTAFDHSGFHGGHSLRAALYVLYPGLYLLGAALYFVTLIVLQWTLSRERHTGYTPINGSTSNT
ncbi:hypothetical protein NP493_1275g00004 [Ridgeia piscesae]|uniref:Major facilitator superfamily (MFS) profile domain-containing protein n=1 Tax=Ridgeia piscesae TaxID=27915 RepID=A0AAD9NGH9_RIDPI|nr:hypothetical protein NP493_1275g00004 [Ridgeia piscesae]